MKHAVFERRLAAAMRSADPVAAVRRLSPDADADGVRISALLVARLRFERLLRGSPTAESWFSTDAAGFSALFARYHAAVAPRAFFPEQEAHLFAGWLRRARLRGRWPGTRKI